MNLFDMADQNSTYLKKQYEELENACQSTDEKDCLIKFVAFVEKNFRVSINIRQSELLDFLYFGRYKNIYELKNGQAQEIENIRGQKPDVENGIKDHLGPWYEKRAAFDRSFEEGEKHKFGALNVGGLGAIHYGPYCLVIKREKLNEYNSLAFIKKDSAGNYVNPSLKITELSKDLANREHVQYLAALKHKKDIDSIPEDKWSPMVCCDSNYIEAVTKDDILSDHIGTIRFSKKIFFSFYKYLYKDFKHKAEKFERYQLGEFRIIQKEMEKLNVEVEVVG